MRLHHGHFVATAAGACGEAIELATHAYCLAVMAWRLMRRYTASAWRLHRHVEARRRGREALACIGGCCGGWCYTFPAFPHGADPQNLVSRVSRLLVFFRVAHDVQVQAGPAPLHPYHLWCQFLTLMIEAIDYHFISCFRHNRIVVRPSGILLGKANVVFLKSICILY